MPMPPIDSKPPKSRDLSLKPGSEEREYKRKTKLKDGKNLLL